MQKNQTFRLIVYYDKSCKSILLVLLIFFYYKYNVSEYTRITQQIRAHAYTCPYNKISLFLFFFSFILFMLLGKYMYMQEKYFNFPMNIIRIFVATVRTVLFNNLFKNWSRICYIKNDFLLLHLVTFWLWEKKHLLLFTIFFEVIQLCHNYYRWS